MVDDQVSWRDEGERGRGPDPIARWLGDDAPRPERGRGYGYTDEFLRELNSVLSDTGVFAYDGRYRRYGLPNPLPLPDDQPWEYREYCGCERCTATRRLRNPTLPHPYQDEWDRARAEYRAPPFMAPPSPRLRPLVDRPRNIDPDVWAAHQRFVAEWGTRSVTVLEALRSVGRVAVEVTSSFDGLARAVRAAIVDVVEPDLNVLARWADDGGAIGSVDY